MGISAEIADIIVAEHAVRPLPNEVHLLGRQTVYVSLETCLALCRKYGVVPCDTEVQLDTSTVGAIQNRSELYVTDSTFFRLLGVENVSAIDHSDYEGAELVIDLGQPLEQRYFGIASFIFGGSVLDNVFDSRRYIENVSLLLNEGGRLIDANMIIPTR